MENNVMQEPELEEVRIRAYRFWEERGRPEGSAEEDWFRAEQSLRDDRARLAAPASRHKPAKKRAMARAAS